VLAGVRVPLSVASLALLWVGAAAGAESLASEASQAAILGQYEQARNLLREGTAPDETSPSLSPRSRSIAGSW